MWFHKLCAMHEYIYILHQITLKSISFITQFKLNSLHLFYTHSKYNTLTLNESSIKTSLTSNYKSIADGKAVK